MHVSKNSNRPKIVGITGGIGAGKSSARRGFALLRVPSIDFDTVARDIHQDPAHPATQAIAQTFAGWMTKDGALQRGSLRQLFAQDAGATRTLIDLMTPHVLASAHRWTLEQHVPYVVWESALLFQEAIGVDRLLIVEAPAALRMDRIRRRNPDWSEQHIASLLAMQSACETGALATHPVDLIQNDSTPESLREQVETMHRRYGALWS